MELQELVERVDGPESFLEFAKTLLTDREAEVGKPVDPSGRGVNGWENHTIEEFLEAAIRWGESSQFGAAQGLRDASPWKRCAVFLLCGKVYE